MEWMEEEGNETVKKKRKRKRKKRHVIGEMRLKEKDNEE